MKYLIFTLFSFLASSAAFAQSDLSKAPQPFTYKSSQAVFVDFQTVTLNWEFNVSGKTTTNKAVVEFSSDKKGYPIFDLIPSIISAKLNGNTVQVSSISPGNATTMRVVDIEVEANSKNVLEIEYKLSSSDITFSGSSIRFGAFMGDLSDRNFFEQYAPSNLEYDQYYQTMFLSLRGTTTEHEIFTNGFIQPLGGFDFKIEFPGYFTTSSFYFHLVNKGYFQTRRFFYVGKGFTFPVTIYASTSSLVSTGETRTKQIMYELETTYGIWGHDSLTVYMTPSGGGMEYGGATMTSTGALGHELIHSWFARGVMPANGNAGWIDEAIASWRDNGYPRRTTGFSNSPINLGGFSQYRRHTTSAAYSSGASFISYLDGTLASVGGMKEMLTLLWIEKRRQTITVPMFQSFLEEKSGKDLSQLFNFYVYGRRTSSDVAVDEIDHKDSTHHKYTIEELKNFR